MIRNQNMTIGKRIREERKRKGLTLNKMADMIGLSVPYLSQIENGHVNINISSLESIGNALELPIVNFFVSSANPDISLIRNSERRWFALGEKVAESLLVKSKSNIEIFIIRLEPGSDTVHDSSHAGEEFSYVIKGEVRVVLNQRLSYDLSEGDILFYKSEIPHFWQNLGKAAAEVLVTNTPAAY